MQPLTVLRQQATAEEQRLQGLRAEAGQLQQAQAMRQRAATGGATR
jgi:hypothetical protein